MGDYAVVLVAGKSRSLKFTARIDSYDKDDCEHEGAFLQKVNSNNDSGVGDKRQTLAANKKDAAPFAPNDIVFILPSPVAVADRKKK